MRLLHGSERPDLAPAGVAGAGFFCPGAQSPITAKLARKCQTCARFRYAIDLDPDALLIAPELSECANYVKR